MQHAGIQYGQGAANSHQSPPFVHADISQTNGGNTTSSLRQFRKKDGLDKNSSTDLNTSENIARVAPHSHYPPRANDYYRYHHQYDYNSPFKEPTAQVKYSEIAETPPQPHQHVDPLASLQKHKEPHKDFMDMCNITQQAHMKQTYPDNLTRQQSYPPDAASVHQYLHKEPQVHNYKPESQYQQYPQLSKYNMPSQCRKYPPPPPENDFLAKLQRINPSMARSIISDHHIRESQANYSMEQNRMYQNQRYYPHLQNNPAYNYHMPQPYNYPSCNYKHPDYARANQMAVGGTQYPTPERSLSPRNLHMPMNYGAAPQKISPNYTQYNHPEYAQHYQHRRASLPQDYYQQTCRTNPYIPTHPQISPEPNDSRASSGLRHFIENWAEEEAPGEIAPIYKENIRLHNDSTNEQVFVINSSEIPIENIALVPTENGQYIIKGANLDNSVVRVKETTENNGERTVNLQIVESASKPDCMLAETPQDKTNEDPVVPYPENQTKDCDEENIKTNSVQEEKDDETKTVEEEPQLNTPTNEEVAEKIEENSAETSVIVCNDLSAIKDMPLIEEDHENKTPPSSQPTSPQPATPPEPELDEDKAKEEETSTQSEEVEDNPEPEENTIEKEPELPETCVTSTTKRTQRIFSVDDIINNIGPTTNQTRRNSLQLNKIGDEENKEETPLEETPLEDNEPEDEPSEEVEEEIEFANAISVEDDSVILEIGGALVQLNINNYNGTKILSVLPLSESLVIDVNGNYQECQENEDTPIEETQEQEQIIEDENLQPVQEAEDISTGVCQSEIVIGEESMDNDIFIDLTVESTTTTTTTTIDEEEPILQETAVIEEEKTEVVIPKVVASEAKKPTKRKERSKISIEERKKCKENEDSKKKLNEIEDERKKHKENEDEKKPKETDDEKKKSKEIEDEKKKPKETDEDKKKPKEIDSEKRKTKEVEDDKKKSKEVDDDKKKPTTKKTKDHDRKESEERPKTKKQAQKVTEDDTKIRKPKSVEEKKKVEEKPIEDDDTKIRKLKSVEEKKKVDDKPIEDDTKIRKPKPVEEKKKVEEKPTEDDTKVRKPKSVEEKKKFDDKSIEDDDIKIRKLKPVEEKKKVEEKPIEDDTKVRKPKPVEEKKKVDEKSIEDTKSEKPPNFSTKAAKKLYVNEIPCTKTTKEIKKNEEKLEPKVSKLEETVNKIKSLKEKSAADDTKVKKPSIKDVNEKKIKIPKRVTFNLETEIREITNDEIDRKKLSWEEYNSRKRRLPPEYQEKKIMEDTVTSSEDINDQVVEQVELSIENAMKKKSPPRVINNNWEDDPDSPKMEEKNEVIPKINRCIIDVNEFNIKPIESVSTPSPVSSTQFSYSEDDSLQVYKDVVDSKLNSLNIKIPKVKPKPVDKFSVLLERFLNKASLDCNELEKVKKIIEFKRKIEEKQLTYEVRNEREKDLKLHFRKVPEKSRSRKRFRNLYADDTSDESDSSREGGEGVEGDGVGDYSVYQRNSAGVPKLIFKRKSGLPQPFVKLERSQAVELLAKKRKLY